MMSTVVRALPTNIAASAEASVLQHVLPNGEWNGLPISSDSFADIADRV